MLYSVRVGSHQAVPNKLIWFSDAVLLFVVEWRQNLKRSTSIQPLPLYNLEQCKLCNRGFKVFGQISRHLSQKTKMENATNK